MEYRLHTTTHTRNLYIEKHKTKIYNLTFVSWVFFAYTTSMESYISELNHEQQQAVMHTEGPLLIVAGAGTGKTKTLTRRIYHLIRSGIAPENILAITFTNKAAAEMRERVQHLMHGHSEYKNEMPFMSTFHALGAFLLRNHADRMGLKKHFVIADSTDQKGLIKDAMHALDINPKQWEPKRIRSIISKNKGDLVTPSDYQKTIASALAEITHAVWVRYEELLAENSAIDFDDLLCKTHDLLNGHPDILNLYQNKWKYIHIDEYQDTNTAQYRIAKLLAAGHKNICVVGDGDQNIYSWRGADMRNMLNFEKDYPGARAIVLERNYRSTQNILTAADEVIKKNSNRIPKKLHTENEAGHAIKIYHAFSERDEATFIAEQCGRSIALGADPREIAVLFRTNFQSRAIEEALLHSGIQYQVLGVKFFDRKEIKDVLSYIRAALNPESLGDIARIINTPKRGIGKATLAKIFAGQAESLTPKVREKYTAFTATLALIKKTAETETASNTVRITLEKSGLIDELIPQNEEDAERIANMKELVSYATRYDHMAPVEGIAKLMEDAALMGEQDSLENKKDLPAVRLMTIHASKGLEFDHVFITGLEQGLFPSQRDDEKKEDTEEERRLMYVALTRARKNLYLSHARTRRVYGDQELRTPSEFLMDIPPHIAEHIADPWTGEQGGEGDGEKIIYLDF